jgi:anti-sigma B factor antagonist
MSEIKGNLDLVSPPSTRDGAILATVRGEVDLHNSPELRAALLGILGQSLPKKLVLNLAEVPYMDSSAVAVLVEVLQKLRRVGGRLMLSALQPRVKGLLEIARLDSIFVLTVTDDEALAK